MKIKGKGKGKGEGEGEDQKGQTAIISKNNEKGKQIILITEQFQKVKQISLKSLAATFISDIKKAPNRTLDFNDFTTKYQVQKRRGYDVTNVLESIKYLGKSTCGTFFWIGGDDDGITQEQLYYWHSQQVKKFLETGLNLVKDIEREEAEKKEKENGLKLLEQEYKSIIKNLRKEKESKDILKMQGINVKDNDSSEEQSDPDFWEIEE